MDYTIVVPVYNSMHTLQELINRICITLHSYTFEIILVDDASIDDSWKALQELKLQNVSHNIVLVKLVKNVGQHCTTLCGITQASADCVITIDDDLQIPPEEIIKLITYHQQNKNDVVYGIYNEQQQSFIRNNLRTLAYTSLKPFNSFMGKASSFRLINRWMINNLSKHSNSFVNIDETIQWYSKNIGMINVKHVERKDGQSGYNLWSLSKLVFNTIFNYYSFPLQFIIYIGFYISLGSILLATFYILKKLLFQVSVEGWTTLIVALLFSTGIIVFCLGIIGRYLVQIITIQNGKPPYVISDIQK